MNNNMNISEQQTACSVPEAAARADPSAPPPPENPAALSRYRDDEDSSFEILPGLRVRLGGRRSVDLTPVCGDAEEEEGGRSSSSVSRQLLTVRAETFSLGPPDLFLTGTGLGLRATVVTRTDDDNDDGPFSSSSGGNTIIEVTNAALSVATASLGPLMDARAVKEFLVRFGPSGIQRRSTGDDDVDDFLPLDDDADMALPGAGVGSFECRLPDCGTSVEFPRCEGAKRCTLRALLGYYVRTILEKLGEPEGDGSGNQPGGEDAVSLAAATRDCTSVYGSAIGMGVGSVLFGPVGFIAGSYYGGEAGRHHSSALLGAAAGAVLLGPVGLLAGAIAGSRRDMEESAAKTASASAEAPKRVVGEDADAEERGDALDGAAKAYLSSNKNELAGTTGVLAGAAAGAAVLGPLGVIPGALAGSISGRKMVRDCSTGESDRAAAVPGKASSTRDGHGGSLPQASVDADQGVDCGGGVGETVSDRPYQFGDFTRGIVADGKKSRGASKNEGYKFGDFTRGLFK